MDDYTIFVRGRGDPRDLCADFVQRLRDHGFTVDYAVCSRSTDADLWGDSFKQRPLGSEVAD